VPSGKLPSVTLNECSRVTAPAGVILNTVPATDVPPDDVVPKKLPPGPCTRPARGYRPSIALKACSSVNVPPVVVLNAVLYAVDALPEYVTPYRSPSAACSSGARGLFPSTLA
jgi:hypothetical protein